MNFFSKFNLWKRYKKSLDLERRFKNVVNDIERRNRSQFLTQITLHSTDSGVSAEAIADREVIVSLTSYGDRLYEAYLAIESIMQQTVKPNRIILWLDYSLDSTILPVYLQKQKMRGLEIRFCEDIKSYKKLIPTLEAFPNSVIITVDDDLMYTPDMIEKLINAYIKEPTKVHCNRMHKMKLCTDGTLDKYINWEFECKSQEASPFVFPTGGGGILYPPGCFSEEVMNKNVFMKICPHADDVWFKCMSLMNGTLCQKVFTHDRCGNEYIASEYTLDNGLYNINVGESKNDEQIKAVFEKYNLYEFLK